jgi:CopG family nickel-responsive transcriptional regulator
LKTPGKRPNGNSNGKVQRISVSLSESVFCELDQLVAERGWENRSKAISVMVTQSALEHREENGETLMAGTITIVYDESQGNLLQRLAELERRFLDVLLVQGPARSLQKIADQLLALKGVKTGKLTLTTMLMPPLHPLPSGGHEINHRRVTQQTKRS